ncbi:MAG TPA: maleylpyruvate isomerase family mycothiol-dependent enzyme [Acidimicrobiales bacterium]|nr:maleylpyruvate isomerase family mycothiol-dependent enzyme [Acidimicrobiales bacterium]
MTGGRRDVDDVMSALAMQHRDLETILTGLDGEQWKRPTRCPGWDVADVVLHLAQTDEMAIASLEDRMSEFMTGRVGGEAPATVDDGAAIMVARERGRPAGVLFERWRAGSDRLQQGLQQADGHRRVQWVAGQLSVRTLATTRLAEAWIHTGDVAGAVGVDVKPDGRLRHLVRLAWRTLPYAYAREGMTLHGPVAFELTGPSGQHWSFVPDRAPATVVRGEGAQLCLVAARRAIPSDTGLTAEGVDAETVLALVRTYA